MSNDGNDYLVRHFLKASFSKIDGAQSIIFSTVVELSVDVIQIDSCAGNLDTVVQALILASVKSFG